jgi:hypothetical protein
MTRHPSKDLLERYSLSRSTPEESAQVEQHLLVCEECRTCLAELDTYAVAMRSALQVAASFPAHRPLQVVHYTAEGPVYSRSRKIKKGRWLAVHEGPNLEGGRFCKTLRQANEYLYRSFVEMFPEHRCTPQCGPIHRGDHAPD